MELFTYISSLLPSFSKDRVTEDARIIYAELEKTAIASYKNSEKTLLKYKFKNPKVLLSETYYREYTKVSKGTDFITGIRENLELVLTTLAAIQEKLENEIETDITVAGITILKANLVRMVEGIGFISRFSYDLLNYIYIMETSDLEEDPQSYISEQLSKKQIELIEKNQISFFRLLAAFARKQNDIVKQINAIPNIVLNKDNESMINGISNSTDIDPLMMNHLEIPSHNPIYHIGIMVAEWQAARYKKAVETKKVLELRAMNLKMQNERNPNAKLQNEIVYLQNRINDLEFKIAKAEKGLYD
jgi:hypothetical protein